MAMPIYEYVPDDRDCFMCDGRIEVLQDLDDAPLRYCPGCGLEVIRVVSRASIASSSGPDADRAAKRGFTTWRKSGLGTWEKVSGPGVDYLVGTSEQVEEAQKPHKQPNVLDLDTSES